MLKFNKNPFETQNRYGGYAAHGYGSDPLSKGNLARTSMPVGADTGYSRSPFSLPRAGGTMGVFPQADTSVNRREELEQFRSTFGRDPIYSVGADTKIEQQKMGRLREQEQSLAGLRMQQEEQELRSKMAFRPVMDQMRMGMMQRMGATTGIAPSGFGTMAGGPQPARQPTYTIGGRLSLPFGQGGALGGGMATGSPFAAGSPTAQSTQFVPPSWMQSMNAPQFPRY
jgi:hypothetical protein